MFSGRPANPDPINGDRHLLLNEPRGCAQEEYRATAGDRGRSTARSVLTEAVLVCLVMAACTALAVVHLFWHVGPDWYRSIATTTSRDFGPSVMVALGQGFVEPRTQSVPALSEFLDQTRPSLSAADLPTPIPASPVGPWQERHRYLLWTVGAVWRVFGISWNVVKGLLACLFGLTGVAAYGLMRLGMSRGLSLVATAAFLVYPRILSQLPSVRDFAKAPFILASVFLIGCLVKRPVSRRAFWGLAALLGIVQGVGMGFRHDVYVCTCASAAILLVCERPKPGRVWLDRAVAVGLLLATFLTISAPIRNAYRLTGAPVHDVIVGLATMSEDDLLLSRASYERFYVNHDNLVYATECGYAQRVLNSAEPFTYDSHRAEQAGLRFLWDNIRTFPGDALARGYAAILWALRGGRDERVNPEWYERIWQSWAVYVAAAALVLISARNMRKAWLLLFLLCFFGGYASLQFQYRHAFHLRFIGIWTAGFACDQLLRAGLRLFTSAGRTRVVKLLRSPRPLYAPALRATAFLGIALALLFLPLQAARAYQDRQVAALLDRYAAADLEPVGTETAPLGDWTLFRPARRSEPCACGPVAQEWPFRDAYWAAVFAGHPQERACWLAYEIDVTGGAPLDFSCRLTMDPVTPNPEQSTTLFFPTHECQGCTLRWHWSRFAGIAVPRERASEFKGLYRVRNPEAFALWPVVHLPSDRTAYRRHQTLNAPPKPGIPPGQNIWGPFRKGLTLALSGDLDGSVAAYRETLALDPKNMELAMGLGAVLERKQDWDGAAETYRQAIAASPEFPAPYIALDALYARRKDPSGCVAEWRQCTQRYPDSGWARFHLGLALESVRDTAAAMEAYRSAHAALPNDAVVAGRLMNALERSGAVDEALRVGLDVADRTSGSYAACRNLDPLLVRMRDPEAMSAAWRDLITRHPNAPLPHYYLGVALHHQGDVAGAMEQYRQVLAVDPRHVETYARLFAAYREKGNVTAARRIARRIRAQQSMDLILSANVLRQEAERCSTLGNWDHALVLFRTAIEWAPEDLTIRTSLASALEGHGFPDDAIEVYRRAIDDEPTAPWLYEQLDALLGRHREAATRLAQWESLRAKYPDIAFPYVPWGRARAACGDQDGALAAYRHAVELDPSLFQAQVELGDLFLERGEYQEAIAPLRAAIQLRPDYDRLYLSLVTALCETRQYEAARDELQECRNRGITVPPEVIERVEHPDAQEPPAP